MTAFEVSVNGRRVCLAGASSVFSLSASITWFPESRRDVKTSMCVNAMESITSDWLSWSMPTVGVGSEVSIRIVEVDAADLPDVREVHDAAKSRAEFSGHVRHHVERLPLNEARRLVDELAASVAARGAAAQPSH